MIPAPLSRIVVEQHVQDAAVYMVRTHVRCTHPHCIRSGCICRTLHRMPRWEAYWTTSFAAHLLRACRESSRTFDEFVHVTGLTPTLARPVWASRTAAILAGAA